MNQVRSPDPDIDEININKEVTPPIEVMNNESRRSPRLNLELKKGKK